MDFRSYIKNLLKESEIDEPYRDLLTQPEPLKVFQNAFTHSSYDPENNYEVLEFIGDGIVKAINSQYIPIRFKNILEEFKSKSGTGEGTLSKIRRYLEQSKFQYPIAMELNMWDYVRADETTKTQKRNKTLEDVIEAYIGALTENIDKYIYPGFGYLFAKRFLTKQLDKMDVKITPETLDDPVTRLNELYKANELKGGRQLKWGDAKYRDFLLQLPKVNGFPPIQAQAGTMIFNNLDSNAYYSDGRKWIFPSQIPVGVIPKALDIGIDPRQEENKEMFQQMWWTVVYGKDFNQRQQQPDYRKINNELRDLQMKLQNPNLNPIQIQREFSEIQKAFDTSSKGFKNIIGQGLSFTKKESKMIAARNALKYLKNLGYEK